MPNFMTRLCRVVFYLTLGLPLATQAAQFSVRILDQNGNPVSSAVVESSLNPVTQAIREVAIIDQIDKRFVPMVVAVQQGQHVNFPNHDNIRHHVYSFSSIRQFSTELYAGIPGEPVLFDKTGVAVLGCNIHDSMVGYIYVSASQDFAVTDVSGMVSFTLPIVPPEITIWHPWSADPDNQRQVSTSSIDNDGLLEITLTINEPSQAFGFRALSGN
ncbi:MAG: methylamine utilization protein [Gammaproteobacteria bacterium]|nr:methylamine utilization protein [Gammaproteobacteria bacterium]MDP2139429.1 methylamine utilization protein [Gammaproteobacteria bacterium]MDP2346265.1 methylamine utilization protein [Gammaproteobacteria bacterium]